MKVGFNVSLLSETDYAFSLAVETCLSWKVFLVPFACLYLFVEVYELTLTFVYTEAAYCDEGFFYGQFNALHGTLLASKFACN
jgi:hypothetical protein